MKSCYTVMNINLILFRLKSTKHLSVNINFAVLWIKYILQKKPQFSSVIRFLIHLFSKKEFKLKKSQQSILFHKNWNKAEISKIRTTKTLYYLHCFSIWKLSTTGYCKNEEKVDIDYDNPEISINWNDTKVVHRKKSK